MRPDFTMNFRIFLSVFVVVCLGPWLTATDVFIHLRKSRFECAREGTSEESKRKLNGDAGVPIINSLVQLASKARTWTQWLRRLLKALRKWCNSHPPEVKLGKCLARYFNVPFPGIGRFEKRPGYKDESKVTEHPTEVPKMCASKPQTVKGRNHASQKSALKGNPLSNNFISPFWEFFRDLNTRFSHYRNVMFGNDLAACLEEYILKKFWMWVDSAPDSRSLL